MLINLPNANQYLVIKQHIKSPALAIGPETINTPNVQNTLSGIMTIRGWMYSETHKHERYTVHPIDLQPGDWFKIKRINRVNHWQANNYKCSYTLVLETNTGNKDRKWFKERLPKGLKYASRSFEIRPQEINGLAELVDTREEAKSYSEELLKKVATFKIGRFNRTIQ